MHPKPRYLKGWIKIDTGQVHQIRDWSHGDVILRNPDLYGVRDEVADIKERYNRQDPARSYECTQTVLKGDQWARYQVAMNELHIEARDIATAHRALKAVDKAKFFLYGFPNGIRLDGKMDGETVHLQSIEDIDFFLRHGRIRRTLEM